MEKSQRIIGKQVWMVLNGILQKHLRYSALQAECLWMIRKQRLPFIRFQSYLYETQQLKMKNKDSKEWIYSS